MTTFEWPPDSGRLSEYTDTELALIRELRETYERDKSLPRTELLNELTVLHELKVEFGVDLGGANG